MVAKMLYHRIKEHASDEEFRICYKHLTLDNYDIDRTHEELIKLLA